jgi:hypothetical protein
MNLNGDKFWCNQKFYPNLILFKTFKKKIGKVPLVQEETVLFLSDKFSGRIRGKIKAKFIPGKIKFPLVLCLYTFHFALIILHIET